MNSILKLGRRLRTALFALLIAAGLSLVTPTAAHADPYHRVCLSSSSYTYAYLTLNAYSGISYLNRGNCSSASWSYVLVSVRPSPGTHCFDQDGKAYYSGTFYPIVGTKTLRCYAGSW